MGRLTVQFPDKTDEILAELAAKDKVSKTEILLVYLAAVTALLFIDYFTHLPSQSRSISISAKVLQNYTALSNLALDRTQRLFEQFVETSMLPVLMAILGYIFGVRSGEREER